jgi:hypothetical protein
MLASLDATRKRVEDEELQKIWETWLPNYELPGLEPATAYIEENLKC